MPVKEEAPPAEASEKETPSANDPCDGRDPNFTTEIIGRSCALRSALRAVEVVARTDATVLILGETGTGKELIARAIHNLSARRSRVLSKIDCAAIPGGLLESELFGYERGAFTGAVARKGGRIEVADNGTLFLDEIGDIPLELQPKFLRVLQDMEFQRVGGLQTQRVNIRVVAATSRDLGQMVADRHFRNDLFYRLSVFPIRIPSLRERLEDIPQLVRHFVMKYSRQMKKEIQTIPPEVIPSLRRHCWPGNIRELENFIERSVILSSGNVLDAPLGELENLNRSPAPVAEPLPPKNRTLAEYEGELIRQTLDETHWVVGGPFGAAARLGLKRTTLIWKMEKLGISKRPKAPSA